MNGTGRALAHLCVIAALAAGGAQAAAKDSGAIEHLEEPADLARAKAEFERATTAYRLGKFEEALEAYERSYEAAPLPAILFNMGQCQFQLKRYERAIFFYRGYLHEAPDATNRAFVRAQIREAERRIAARLEEDRRRREAEEQRLALEARVLELTLAQQSGAHSPHPATEAATLHHEDPMPDVDPHGEADDESGALLWTVAGAGAAGSAILVLGAASLTAGGVFFAARAAASPPPPTLGTLDYR